MLRPALDRIFDEVLADRRLLAHPFYRRWEAGALEPGELASYGEQYRYFEQLLPDVLQAVVDALPEGEARELTAANLHDERAVPAPHVELFDAFLRAAGGDPAAAAGPAATALVDAYRDAAAAGPVAALAAVAAYELQAPAIAVSKAEGLRTHYDMGRPDTLFWDVHGVMDESHSTWVLDALAALPADLDEVGAVARRTADAWWAFLDEREAAAELAVC
ncbi:MAG TPA: iron-containing redox enzyme family protein [Acidimicrobiales bacterium]|nr:iron-containing redox enzyme family protein [Acidimicrobiales bacterium]